jgi:hypothetical protein
LDEMLKLTNGVRQVPVVVQGQTVSVGFNRGS